MGVIGFHELFVKHAEVSREVELGVIELLIKLHGAGSFKVIAVSVPTDVPAYIGIGIILSSIGSLCGRRYNMALGEKLTPKTIKVLDYGSARRSRMKTMSNGIPGKLEFMTTTFIMDMQEELLCHSWTYNRSQQDVDEEKDAHGEEHTVPHDQVSSSNASITSPLLICR